MSTTVSYKGNTLTTVSNNTKTLETEGKYLEADIILTDVSGGITPTGNINITASGQTDVTNYATATVPDAEYFTGTEHEYFAENGTRMWRYRGFTDLSVSEGDVEGWIGEGTQNSDWVTFNAIPTGTTVTPTESSQAIGGNNYIMEGAVTVGAISSSYVGSGITRRDSTDLSASGATVSVPSGYYASAASKAVASGTEGTPTATKGTVSSHSVTVTPSVTNTAGYISGGTHTGTGVSVSASELVSGTYTVSGSGTADVTNYASISVPSGTAGTPTATKGAVSNHSVSVTPSVTNTTGYITGSTKTGTAVTVTASELVSGSETKTENGTYDVTNLAEIVVDVSGGGSSTIQVGTKTATLSAAASSISFTGLSGNPTSFAVTSSANIATNTNGVTAVTWDGTYLHGQTMTTQVTADTGFTKSYSGGTLTITATTAEFQANEYKLIYTYSGSSSDIHTADVQVGSGATSITFSSLSGRPIYWSCIFKSDFSTSSGYQRVIEVVNDGTSIYGMAMDSSAKAQTSWSQTYSGGNLTISSTGTNNGGYFHQPGYYQLTYAVDASAPQYQTKTVSPSTTQQTVLPDNGYDALEEVIVNAMPSMTLPSAASSTSSGTAKATITPGASVQYLNIPTGYNGTAQYYTIGASGGGGGGSISTATTTWSNSSNTTTSHQFTGLSGTPKFAVLRCTSSLSRSSNSTNYFVADIVWDGTNTVGHSYRRSNGTYANKTTGYSVSVSGTSITFSSTGTSTTDPGSFYNGTYELRYVY